MKRCPVCRIAKPLADFNSERRSKDGKCWRCRECANIAKREYWNRNRDACMEANQRWHKANPERSRAHKTRWDERNKDKKRTYLATWERDNPLRRRAHSAVRRALKSGRLVRPDACQRCGETGRLEAHHPDYLKPLDVEWLCVPCHRTTPHAEPDPNAPLPGNYRKHTRLSPQQRQAVATAIASGRTRQSVASEFGVSQATVSNIVRIETGRSLSAAIRAELSLAGSGFTP